MPFIWDVCFNLRISYTPPSWYLWCNCKLNPFFVSRWNHPDQSASNSLSDLCRAMSISFIFMFAVLTGAISTALVSAVLISPWLQLEWATLCLKNTKMTRQKHCAAPQTQNPNVFMTVAFHEIPSICPSTSVMKPSSSAMCNLYLL